MTDGQRLDGVGPPTVTPPRLPWGRALVLSVVIASVALGGEEAFWRSLGHRPSVSSNTTNHWRFWRQQANRRGRTVVLIGASRIQTAFCIETFSQRFPDHRVVQLGVYAGGSPIGTLQELSEDEEFSGIVICDVLAPLLFRNRWRDQELLYGSHAFNGGTAQLLEHIPRWLLEDRLALLRPNLRIRALMESQTWPTPEIVRLRFDRSIELDFSVIPNLAQFREDKNREFKDLYARQAKSNRTDVFLQHIERIEQAVRRIQQRGGKVVFLRSPSSRGRRAIEEEHNPRKDYWDRFAESTSATSIHFEDVAAMRMLTCPDDSHLDWRQRPEFTAALLDELVRHDVL